MMAAPARLSSPGGVAIFPLGERARLAPMAGANRDDGPMRIGGAIKALALVCALATWPTYGAAQAPAPAPEIATTPHLEVQLAPQSSAAVPGSTFYVALRHKIAPGWHTYWRNSGDAGLATVITWTLPEGWSAGEIVWPTPRRYFTGPLMNYVHEGEVYLPVPIEVPPDARPGDLATLVAEANFLVCSEICIPEDARVSLTLPVAADAGPHPRFGEAVTAALTAAPKPADLAAAFSSGDDGLRLAVVGEAVAGTAVERAYFFPFEGGIIDHAAPQSAARGPDGLTLILPAVGGAAPERLAGVLSLGEAAYVVEASLGILPAGASGLASAVVTRPEAGAATGGVGMGLATALVFAFIGGLILNLMPCVFPVLSMKAAALARHAEHPRVVRRQGLAFLAGTLSTFLLLAGVLIAVRAGGEAAGWGFHLQSPAVIAALALLMLLVALNLSGVFEVGRSAQGLGAATPRQGLAGAFFTGVLAVAVAAPCTAPFMAGAIGWAMTRPPVVTLTVFLALGLGLAAPFVALSFAPGLFRRLPRPGPWMDVLRRGLAFPMYGAAAWLGWVFAVQAGVNALPFLFAAAVAIAFAAWAWGLSQRPGRTATARVAAAAALLLALPLAAVGARMSAPEPTAGPAVAALPTEAWSPERVVALQAEGRPVFVDFTAAWCVTCQLNERTSLAGRRVAEAFERTGAVLLKADWTNRDPEIAGALAEHGRSGVPLYLVYGPGPEPAILPQLLTEGMVIRALERAKG